MLPQVNYLDVLIAAVISMIVKYLWYGNSMFGKT
jgi:hypothetical protein